MPVVRPLQSTSGTFSRKRQPKVIIHRISYQLPARVAEICHNTKWLVCLLFNCALLSSSVIQFASHGGPSSVTRIAGGTLKKELVMDDNIDKVKEEFRHIFESHKLTPEEQKERLEYELNFLDEFEQPQVPPWI